MATRDAEKIKSIAKEVVKECYNDKEFMDRLSDKFLTVLAKKMNEEVEKQMHILQTKINEMIGNLNTKVEAMDMQLNKVQEDNRCIEQKIVDIENASKVIQNQPKHILSKLNDLEQKTKSSELRLFGLKEEKEEDLRDVLVEMFKTKMGINKIQIDSCYRIGKVSQARLLRPVVIKFVSNTDRNAVFKSKKKLKGTKLAIAEELTRERYDLLKRAKDAFGKQNVWTKSGTIYTKFNGVNHSMRCLEDMEKILNIEQG